MSRENQPLVSPVRLILGLGIVAFGLVLTLDRLDVLDADDALLFWPLVLIAIGLTRIFSRQVPDLVFAGVFILVGAWFLLYNLGWIDVWPQDYLLPALLVVVGTYLIFGGLRQRRSVGTSEQYVSAFAFWSGIERSSSAPDFEGAELTAIMGGVELDLRQAGIFEKPAVINAFTLWGGIDLRVPQDWNIEYRILPILGGYSDETDQSPGPDSPTLVIKGAAIMAGIDVKN